VFGIDMFHLCVTLSGSRCSKTSCVNSGFHWRGWVYGSFTRSFKVPSKWNASSIQIWCYKISLWEGDQKLLLLSVVVITWWDIYIVFLSAFCWLWCWSRDQLWHQKWISVVCTTKRIAIFLCCMFIHVIYM